MAISLDTLIEEKTLLQADFEKVSQQIQKLTNDLAQMKANQNALNGALQQNEKYIALLNEEGAKKDKALKDMVAKV
tara:strand:- start:44 stop:271 length:228 start_codon:yes stop_codon:yes gene_type:complete